MNHGQLLNAALYADFLPRYRKRLALLVAHAHRYANAVNVDVPRLTVAVARAHARACRMQHRALCRAGRALYRLVDAWAGLGIFPRIEPDRPELPLLHAVIEIEHARRAGDAAKRRLWENKLGTAAVRLGMAGKGQP